MQDDSEYITVAQARLILRVSKAKMSKWIANGIVKTIVSPFDARYKLILRADVERLAQQPRPEKKDAA